MILIRDPGWKNSDPGCEKIGSWIRNTAFFHYSSIFFGSRQGPVMRPQASFRTPGMRQQWRQLRRPQFTSCHRRRRRSRHRFGAMSRRLAGAKLLWEQLLQQQQRQQQQLAASPPTAVRAPRWGRLIRRPTPWSPSSLAAPTHHRPSRYGTQLEGFFFCFNQ